MMIEFGSLSLLRSMSGRDGRPQPFSRIARFGRITPTKPTEETWKIVERELTACVDDGTAYEIGRRLSTTPCGGYKPSRNAITRQWTWMTSPFISRGVGRPKANRAMRQPGCCAWRHEVMRNNIRSQVRCTNFTGALNAEDVEAPLHAVDKLRIDDEKILPVVWQGLPEQTPPWCTSNRCDTDQLHRVRPTSETAWDN